jgi:hypothetical protein
MNIENSTKIETALNFVRFLSDKRKPGFLIGLAISMLVRKTGHAGKNQRSPLARRALNEHT